MTGTLQPARFLTFHFPLSYHPLSFLCRESHEWHGSKRARRRLFRLTAIARYAQKGSGRSVKSANRLSGKKIWKPIETFVHSAAFISRFLRVNGWLCFMTEAPSRNTISNWLQTIR